MASLIDETKPTHAAPSTQDVRNNFAAAKTEIEALQAAAAAAEDHAQTGITNAATAQAAAVAAQGTANSAETHAQTGINNAATAQAAAVAAQGTANAINSARGAADGIATLDANGRVQITQMPPAALERLVVVANQAARYALTTAAVQNGDTVKQTDTGLFWFIKDDTQLGNGAGYAEYSVGQAAACPWSGITGKPAAITNLSGTNSGDQDLSGYATTAALAAACVTSTINAQTGASYTFAAADATYDSHPGKLVTFGNAGATTITIPTNATVPIPNGARIECIQDGAGKVTFGGAGVTINSQGSFKAIAGQYVGVTLLKEATDTWYLIGALQA